MSEYYKKYLKYKNKYINLQKQIGSGKYTGLDKNAPYPALQTPSRDTDDSLVPRRQLAYDAQNSKPGDGPIWAQLLTPRRDSDDSLVPRRQLAYDAQNSKPGDGPIWAQLLTPDSPVPSSSPYVPEPIRYPDDIDFTFFQRMGNARDQFIFNPDKIIKEYGNPFHDSAYYPSEMPSREWRDNFIKKAYEAYESRQEERREESRENAIKEKKEEEIQLKIKQFLEKYDYKN